MDDRAEQMQRAKHTLGIWRNLLYNWICWLDSEIADIANGKAPSKTFSLLLQHISLISPWFRGLLDIMPVKVPKDFLVTRCEYQEPNFTTWPQHLSQKKMNGAVNRERDTI